MKKLGTFVFAAAAAGGVLMAGAGLASADVALVPESSVDAQQIVDVGEPDPNGTGSAQAVTALTKLLSSLSSETKPKP
ncbi:hypothetical protein NDR87_09460 [Nocardia sp. CDC159]|uniref:Secreted protein n=1 Tax=Nocardia pulmonis TaxID=2951408 RepID=A0A9X2IXC5_9NOCA|nr:MULTISPECIES: hypothetical protein [Nocardia]MCM6773695.1 hypothetical protein [Nocardia pulmonis]MCM6786582.1 hypothetical protein [Nocardia sp. CDC159]